MALWSAPDAGNASTTTADYHYSPQAGTAGALSGDALARLQAGLYRDFYLRPGVILRHLRQSWRHYLPGPRRGPGTGAAQALRFVLGR